MLTDLGNSASDAFGTRPILGYILNLLPSFVVAHANIHTTLVYAIMIIIIYLLFCIKMNHKMSPIPTIQKLDRAFSVSSFGTHLKPNTFDGTNKRWVHRLELWRIPMNIWFMTEGPPKGPHTFEEERAYQTTNNLFRGAAISVLRENVVDAYMHVPSYKEL